MSAEAKVLFFIDRHSFPKKCPELEDFLSLVTGDIQDFDTENPGHFFREALKKANIYELIVPVTRNLYVRDRLRQEGVSLVVCL